MSLRKEMNDVKMIHESPKKNLQVSAYDISETSSEDE
jgi:hypothetical protein